MSTEGSSVYSFLWDEKNYILHCLHFSGTVEVMTTTDKDSKAKVRLVIPVNYISLSLDFVAHSTYLICSNWQPCPVIYSVFYFDNIF